MTNPSGQPAKKPLSLRERNRIATRDAIAEAAIQLAMLRGIHDVRIEDIAAEAGVSTRTFSNYFSSKYEALTCRHAQRMHHAAVALRDQPADKPLWSAIADAVLAPWQSSAAGLDTPSPETLAELRLLFCDSALQGEILKDVLNDRNEFAHAIGDRVGLDGRGLYCRLLSAAVTTVTQVTIDIFHEADPPAPLLPLLREALGLLSSAFPIPAPETGAAGKSEGKE